MGRDRENRDELINPYIEIEGFDSVGKKIGIVTVNTATFSGSHGLLIHPLDREAQETQGDNLYKVWAVVSEYDPASREIKVMIPRTKSFLGYLDDRTVEESDKICMHSLVLYCRELDLIELALTTDLFTMITGMFSANVILESLRREGFITPDGPLLIYKKCEFSMTKDADEIIEKAENILNELSASEEDEETED